MKTTVTIIAVGLCLSLLTGCRPQIVQAVVKGLTKPKSVTVGQNATKSVGTLKNISQGDHFQPVPRQGVPIVVPYQPQKPHNNSNLWGNVSQSGYDIYNNYTKEDKQKSNQR